MSEAPVVGREQTPAEPETPRPPAHGAFRGLAAAIYGQVVVTSIVAALEIHEQSSPGRTLAAVIATMIVFWLAHAYAEALVNADTFRETLTILREEGWMVIVSLPTLCVLVLGVAGVLSREDAALISVYVGAGMLFLFGLISAQRAGRSAPSVVFTALAGALFGLAVVALKVLSH